MPLVDSNGTHQLYICPYLWVYFTHFDYWNLTSSGQMITHTGATKKGLFSIISLTLTTDNNSDIKRSMSSFLLWFVPPLKAKTLFMPHILLHSPYLCLIEVSCGWDLVLCVAKNIFSFKGVATNHKSTIHILFVCTWPLLFYSNTNTAFYLLSLFVCLSCCVEFAGVSHHVLYYIVSCCWLLLY